MDQLLTSERDTIFVGVGFVRRSGAGWFYAQLSRLLGGPLVWRQGEQVTTTVRVAPTTNGLRCWHRTFTFEDGSQQLVQTTKVVDPKLGLLDAVGAQGEKILAMRMRVRTEGKSLHFVSDGYVLRIGRLAIPVPSLIGPGQLHAEHRDLGDGEFLYSLQFDHPIWGQTFHQEGVFRQLD
ncbi:MAG: DUF4166 domain-containing protein [Hyphomicrobium sp.]|nr:DUF4166 domain-containing protein [Hyphomicrobium sp.]